MADQKLDRAIDPTLYSVTAAPPFPPYLELAGGTLTGSLQVVNPINPARIATFASNGSTFSVAGTADLQMEVRATGLGGITFFCGGAAALSFDRNRLGTFYGNTSFTGATNTFLQNSINATALGPLTVVTETVSGVLAATDSGKVLVAAPAVNQDLTITLPAVAATGFLSGQVFELVNNVPTVGKYFYIQAPAGVSLFYNSTLGGSGDGTLGGGVGARFRLRGPMTSVRLLRVDGATWFAFGDLVGA